MGEELGPVALTGSFVRLEPLRPRHAGGLLHAGEDPEIWQWLSRRLLDRESVDRFIADAMEAESRGNEYAFAVIRLADERVVGSTRFMDIQRAHRGVEIGWTWYAKDVWGTVVNPEAKYLLLEHAFERWGAIRVALKTDGKNVRSQGAIRKLGAQYEGVLRSHRIRPDGSVRDTVMYSILSSEWPAVKKNLLARL